MTEKEYIEFLESLTRFIFDKSVFKRIAMKRGLALMSFEDACLDEKISDMCEIDLLELVVNSGPNSVASFSIQHGNYRQDIGSEDITNSTLERINKRLEELYEKYDMKDKLGSISKSEMCWINENSIDI